MTLETTQAYITTVGPDHTVVLPDNIEVGTTVAVIVMSNVPKDDERQARFVATLAAIRAASATTASLPPISDADLEDLIQKARQSSHS